MIEAVLNRWRGTGDLFSISKIKITGTMVYALYMFVVVTLLSTWYYGIGTAVLFLAGESYAWGTWVSYLCYPDNHEKEYTSKVGRGFPYIHYVANTLVHQEKDYKKYCQVALTLRGLYWWLPIYLLLAFAGVISYTAAIVAGLILGVGFPIACELGRRLKLNVDKKYLQITNSWENQEVVYGAMQGLVFWLVVLL